MTNAIPNSVLKNNEKKTAKELITASARDYLKLTLKLPLGNPDLKKVHTNQFLFTELPKNFPLKNWETIANALNSLDTRNAGYVLNRWYIEGVTIDVDVTGKAEMSLDLNAFASATSKYSEDQRSFTKAYSDASNKTSNNKTSTKNKTTSTTKKKTNAVKSKNTTLKLGQGKTINNLVKKIVGMETNPLKKAKLIHAWLKKEVRYQRYCCAKYKTAEKCYKNRKHLNCADTATLTCRMMLAAGLKAYIVHRTYDGGHFWTIIEINGKKYASDQTGNGSAWNTVWKSSGRTTVSNGGSYSSRNGNFPDCYPAYAC